VGQGEQPEKDDQQQSGQDSESESDNASDSNDDEITFSYQWKKSVGIDYDFEDIADETGATLSSDNFVKGNIIKVKVTPNDGTDDGDPMESDPITISNSIPTQPTVSITPNPAYADDDLICVPSDSTDADVNDNPVSVLPCVLFCKCAAPWICSGVNDCRNRAMSSISSINVLIFDISGSYLVSSIEVREYDLSILNRLILTMNLTSGSISYASSRLWTLSSIRRSSAAVHIFLVVSLDPCSPDVTPVSFSLSFVEAVRIGYAAISSLAGMYHISVPLSRKGRLHDVIPIYLEDFLLHSSTSPRRIPSSSSATSARFLKLSYNSFSSLRRASIRLYAGCIAGTFTGGDIQTCDY